MKPKIAFLLLVFVLLSSRAATAEEDVTIIAASEAAEGLDLHAVSELFKNAENLAEFEKALNDPDVGVNNLDLDDNGEVDFIRVVEEVADDTHVIILQIPLDKDEYQDIATIEIERTGDDEYNMQVHGNEVIYGVDYYVVPHVHVHTWPIVVWMYGPAYHPYRSVFYFGRYPRWWRPYRPVTVNVYHTRVVKYRSSTTFKVTRTTRVKSVRKVNYTARSSTRVKKKTAVTRTGTGVKGGKSVTKTKQVGGKKTTVKGAKKTTVKGGKKTTKTKATKTKTKKKTTKKKGKKRRN